MLVFWVVNSAEIRCAPKKIRGPTPTMRNPTLMYQRRLCIEDRPVSAEGAATSRVTARQDQLCALLQPTPSLDRYAGNYAGAAKGTDDGEGSRAPCRRATEGALPGGLRTGARAPVPDVDCDHPLGPDDGSERQRGDTEAVRQISRRGRARPCGSPRG